MVPLASKIIKSLYLDGEISDVTFICQGAEFAAHKIILSRGSDVFKTMFYGALPETTTINITDVSAEGFKTFLQFFYFRNVALTMDNIQEVTALTVKYMMPPCTDACTDFWYNNCFSQDLCWAYEWSIFLNLQQFRELCEQKISLHIHEILNDFSVDRCSILEHLLGIDAFLCDEVYILTALTNMYISAEDHQKNALKEVFYKVRFRSIKSLSTALNLFIRGIFNGDELSDVLGLMDGKLHSVTRKFSEQLRNVPKLLAKFDDNNTINYSVKATYSVPGRYVTINSNLLSIKLKCNQPVWLGSLKMAHIPDYSQIEIKIKEEESQRIIHTGFYFVSPDDDWENEYRFSPIVIRP